ncbi:MAG: DUF4260 domain-containing protein [Candidatus Cyclobacteriaceae bacterium M3_2C_046]
MKILIRLEEIAKLFLAFFASLQAGFDWWWFWLLLLLPDVSMVGYLLNTRTGAIIYNLFHHQGVAIAFGLTGLWLDQSLLQMAGIIIFGHSAMDRAVGYGLKYPDHFNHTHLGWIGLANSKTA